MLTVLEAIKLSTEFLEKKGIESPRINAELLLSSILQCKRLNLYLSFDRPLKENEISVYRELIKRRGQSEPLQYIIGEVEFYGLPFKVNRSVLIPRQETEILVESVIEYCKDRGQIKILDIGTGSGNIAVTLAKHLPEAAVTAVDISEPAVLTAGQNAELNGVAERISFKLADINNFDHPDSFDIIVSNPPYISAGEFETLRPELKIYEPGGALTDYSDGFFFFTKIASLACKHLKKGGMLFFEMGQGQHEKVSDIMKENSFSNITIRKDYLGIERVIMGELN
jgi:release factor glutamine methyltransferase